MSNCKDRGLMPGMVVMHFKGKFYRIEDICTDATNTGAGHTMVKYRQLYPPYDSFVREETEFCSKVDREKYPDAEQEYRMEKAAPEYNCEIPDTIMQSRGVDCGINPQVLRYYNHIISHVPARDRLEQVAEEAAELTKAALKVIRSIEPTNPTPVKPQEALTNLFDEYKDVLVAFSAAALVGDKQLPNYPERWGRWAGRTGYKE